MEQKKKALGKGLEELFSSEVLDFDTFESNIMENTPANDVKEIPVNEIRPNPYQPRKTFNEEALNELLELREQIIYLVKEKMVEKFDWENIYFPEDLSIKVFKDGKWKKLKRAMMNINNKITKIISRNGEV